MEKIKDLNLSEDVLLLMEKNLKWTMEEILNTTEEDYRWFDDEQELVKWIYDGKYDASYLVEALSTAYVTNKNGSLLENFVESLYNVFYIDGNILFIYA